MTLNPRHNASFLVYGETKVGKSSLAGTAPGTKLLIDAEGSGNAFEGRKNPNNNDELYRVTYWDDIAKPPPKADGTWDICVVDVLRWETVEYVLQWVSRRDHPFQSIIMDSVTEIQNRCKKAVAPGDEALQYEQWGKLLTRMSDKVKGFRDIVKDIANPARCVVFTSEGKHRMNGAYTPQMEGSLRNAIGYWVNTTACLRVAQAPNADGIIAPDSPLIRRLYVKPFTGYTTGSHFEDRFEKNTIDDPNITDMMSTIFPGFTAA